MALVLLLFQGIRNYVITKVATTKLNQTAASPFSAAKVAMHVARLVAGIPRHCVLMQNSEVDEKTMQMRV